MTNTHARLLLLTVAGGFALMLIDVRHMHVEILGEKWRAWVPLTVAAFGLIATAMLFVTSRAQPVAYLACAAGVASGLFGTYLHSEGDAGRLMNLFAARDFVVYAFGRDDSFERGSNEAQESAPPVLAPLGLSGLCVFGAIGAMALRRTEEES